MTGSDALNSETAGARRGRGDGAGTGGTGSPGFAESFADGAHTNEVIEKCTEGAKLIKYTQ